MMTYLMMYGFARLMGIQTHEFICRMSGEQQHLHEMYWVLLLDVALYRSSAILTVPASRHKPLVMVSTARRLGLYNTTARWLYDITGILHRCNMQGIPANSPSG